MLVFILFHFFFLLHFHFSRPATIGDGLRRLDDAQLAAGAYISSSFFVFEYLPIQFIF
jgi:hypothetical protein